VLDGEKEKSTVLNIKEDAVVDGLTTLTDFQPPDIAVIGDVFDIGVVPGMGPVGLDEILDKYNLERETATRYIDAITRLNQTQTAEEVEVSRQTINRYKNAFSEMNPMERSQVIASLTQGKLLEQALE